MKDVLKIETKVSSEKVRDIAGLASKHIIAAAAAFAASRAAVFSSLLPFGISFVGGMPLPLAPAAACGAFLGYFIPAVGGGGFRYIAAMLGTVAVRLMLSGYKKLSENPFFMALTVLICFAVTSFVALGGQPYSVWSNTACILISTAATFFVSKASAAFSKNRAGLSSEELACLLCVCGILIMGLEKITFFGASLGRILGALLILTAAKYGGTLSGAISGIAVSLASSLASQGAEYGTVYSVAGMLAGLFAPMGRLTQSVAAVACCFTGAALGGFSSRGAIMLAEMMIGAAGFLLLPRNAGIVLSKLFCSCPKISGTESLKTALSLRLSRASSALGEVSSTVEQVSKELSKINSPDFGEVISRIEQDSCTGCKMRINCWETRRDMTVEAILKMTQAVRKGESEPSLFTTDEFRGRCVRQPAFCASVKKRYLDYAAKTAAENRIEEVRGVISDQFSGISDMLCGLASDLASDAKFDSAAALNAVSALRNLGILARECTARTDKYGRMTVEVQIQKNPDTVINRLQVMRMLSLSCERNFAPPIINTVGGNTFMTLSEAAELSADIGVNQICAGDNTMCGDAYNYFPDGKGRFIMILSDGMGTGGRAAVDGAMASGLMAQLLKAGFGYECSLKILNSSMLFKSTDESLATLDIASVDLFTGETELFKAGAAPTLVRRSGKTGKAESTSVPVGILREVRFDRAKIRLKTGDIVLLMSDGVCSEGTDWIRDELESWGDGNAQELAEHISNCALRRRADSKSDDITVMAAILEKAAPKT